MKKFLIFITVLVIGCGIGIVLFRTDLVPEQGETIRRLIHKVIPIQQKGLIRGIVSSEGSFTALIDNQAVREGDTIHGVRIEKIYANKVDFEKNGSRWTQELNEIPSRQWYINIKIRAESDSTTEVATKT